MLTFVILACVGVGCATCEEIESGVSEYSFVEAFYAGRGITLSLLTKM